MRDSREVSTSNSLASPVENNGLLYGSLLGVFCGVLIAGPHFNDWLMEEIVATIGVSSAVLGITGHLAVCLAYAAVGAAPQDDGELNKGDASDDW